MPSAHWLMVLNVAGATMIASGIFDRGAPGAEYSLRTALPASFSIMAPLKKGRADGVAMTCTVHLRATASRTRVSTCAAGAAAQTITDRTCSLRSSLTGAESLTALPARFGAL